MLVPDEVPEKLEALMVPSTVRLSTAPPVASELTKANVVADVSLRSNVYVPAAILWRVVSLAAILRMLDAESKVRSDEPPDDRVTAPVPVKVGAVTAPDTVNEVNVPTDVMAV